MTNKRVVIAIGAQWREAISGGNMRSRRMLAMTNFVFFASFVVQNRVNRRIDRSSTDALICQSPVGAGLRAALPVPCKGIELYLPRPSVGATLRGCPGRTWKSAPTMGLSISGASPKTEIASQARDDKQTRCHCDRSAAERSNLWWKHEITP